MGVGTRRFSSNSAHERSQQEKASGFAQHTAPGDIANERYRSSTGGGDRVAGVESVKSREEDRIEVGGASKDVVVICSE